MQIVEEANQLAVIVRESGLDPSKATALMDALSPLVAEAGNLVRQGAAITVTDATQVSEMKQARIVRLKLKDVRVSAEKARKELKADALATGRAIDSVGNWIKAKIEPEEARLEECEKFAERAEAVRKEGLRKTRTELLAPFGVDTSFYQLGDMPEATFAALLDSTSIAHAAKIEAARKAEADRLAAEEARKAEEARINAENARLKQEAIAADAAAKVERERVAAEQAKVKAAADAALKAEQDKAAAEKAAADLVIKQEREAREKLEREAESKRKAEAQRVAAEQEAARKAAAAPDKAKLHAIAQAIRDLPMPSVSSPKAIDKLRVITNLLVTTAGAIDDLAEEI